MLDNEEIMYQLDECKTLLKGARDTAKLLIPIIGYNDLLLYIDIAIAEAEHLEKVKRGDE